MHRTNPDKSGHFYRDLICGLTASTAKQLFHPLDTMLRRMQIYRQRIDSMDKFRRAVFLQSHNASVFDRMRSLLQGFWLSASYKIISSTYKFGGQSYFERHIDDIYGSDIRNYVGDKYA